MTWALTLHEGGLTGELEALTLSLHPESDTGTLGDRETYIYTPKLKFAFPYLIEVGGRIYIEIDGVVYAALDDGQGYHIIIAGEEVPGADINVYNLPTLTPETTVRLRAKYTGPSGDPTGTWSNELALSIITAPDWEAEANAIFERASPDFGDPHKEIINETVIRLKSGALHSSNNWAKIRLLNVVTDTDQHSMLNWAIPTRRSILAPDAHRPVLTPNLYYQGSSVFSSLIKTGILMNDAAPYTQNDAAISVGCAGGAINSQNLWGAERAQVTWWATGFAGTVLNDAGAYHGATGPAEGVLTLSRTDSAGFKVYLEASLVETVTIASVDISANASEFAWLGRPGYGSTDCKEWMFCISSGRTANEEADFVDAMNYCRNALAAL